MALNLPLFFEIPTAAIHFAGGPSREIDVPDRFVGIAIAVEERTANVLTKDAAVLGRGLVQIECHLPFIDDVVIRHSGSKVAFTMCSHAYNPRPAATMSPNFPRLVEKVNTVAGKMVQIDRPASLGPLLDKVVKLLADHRQDTLTNSRFPGLTNLNFANPDRESC